MRLITQSTDVSVLSHAFRIEHHLHQKGTGADHHGGAELLVPSDPKELSDDWGPSSFPQSYPQRLARDSASFNQAGKINLDNDAKDAKTKEEEDEEQEKEVGLIQEGGEEEGLDRKNVIFNRTAKASSVPSSSSHLNGQDWRLQNWSHLMPSIKEHCVKALGIASDGLQFYWLQPIIDDDPTVGIPSYPTSSLSSSQLPAALSSEKQRDQIQIRKSLSTSSSSPNPTTCQLTATSSQTQVQVQVQAQAQVEYQNGQTSSSSMISTCSPNSSLSSMPGTTHIGVVVKNSDLSLQAIEEVLTQKAQLEREWRRWEEETASLRADAERKGDEARLWRAKSETLEQELVLLRHKLEVADWLRKLSERSAEQLLYDFQLFTKEVMPSEEEEEEEEKEDEELPGIGIRTTARAPLPALAARAPPLPSPTPSPPPPPSLRREGRENTFDMAQTNKCKGKDNDKFKDKDKEKWGS
ncbi:hypothetical protein CBR_g39428 [Chara braunii]|uniref:Uncharacterized protein n=1 Tax=Chara braunii TaxID=69332 RepID=A0A388LRT9_CHABU|nr:hypothetical protein CBR_g39428 [Chara braunii]|eukprot:GBG84965.1 hypothetical protein CBR_g39428 [Chara braunii]